MRAASIQVPGQASFMSIRRRANRLFDLIVCEMSGIVSVTVFTHRGRVRERNEDTVVVGDWISPPELAAPRSVRHALSAPLLCAVCDGMGGHRGGAIASRHVARRLADKGQRIVDARTAAEALVAIDAELYERMLIDADLLGMGTTVVGLVLAPRLFWFNVGDSRLYAQRGERIVQISVDDVPPGPRSGAITQCLGGILPPREITPHAGEVNSEFPARFLLCSDGLTDMIGDGDIADCLALSDTDAVAKLFDLAMRAGGADNFSAVLASVPETPLGYIGR
jgi:serine/threonine protein phosphatase PrpC